MWLHDAPRVEVASRWRCAASQRRGDGGGAPNRKVVLFTPDCFKRLCVRSRGKKAEDVRTYFIQLEGLVMRYKGMRAEIGRLERNQAAGRSGRPGRVLVGERATWTRERRRRHA